MPRILYCVLLGFASAFAAQPARAQDKVEGTRTGLDYVHASLAIGADLPSFSAKYDLDVTRRPGDWDRVLFEGNRSGTGGLLSAAFGFRLIPQLAAGAQVEFARATASLDHALLEETGVRFAPRLDRMFASLFADARGRGPWHGGLALLRQILRGYEEPRQPSTLATERGRNKTMDHVSANGWQRGPTRRVATPLIYFR